MFCKLFTFSSSFSFFSIGCLQQLHKFLDIIFFSPLKLISKLLTAYIYNRDQTLSTTFLQREENCRKLRSLGTLQGTELSPLRAPLANGMKKSQKTATFMRETGVQYHLQRLVAAGRIIETRKIRDLYGKRETRFTLQRAWPDPSGPMVKR